MSAAVVTDQERLRAARRRQGLLGAPWRAADRVAAYTYLHWAAIIAHGASYLTTFWAVQWVWQAPAVARPLVWQSVAAVLAEMLLFGMKASLQEEESGIGWAGVGIDTVLNAGGILPRAGAVLSFPLVALLVSVGQVLLARAGWVITSDMVIGPVIYDGQPVVITVGGLLVALAGGMLLSAAPGKLWAAAERALARKRKG